MTKLKECPITWEAAAAICPEYADVLSTEFLGHELHVTEHGTLRWVADPEREQELMDKFGAKDLNALFMNGADSNDPEIRLLYKCMGYSLSGFYDVFYWEVNNEHAYKYHGRNFDESKKMFKLELMVEVDVNLDEDEFAKEFEQYLKHKYKIKNLYIEE